MSDDVDDVDEPSFEPRRPSRQYLESRRYYGILLLLIVISIGFGIAASEERWGSYLYFAFQAGTLLLALRASHASRRTFRIAMVLVTVGLIAGLASAVAGDVRTDRIMTGAVGAALVLMAIIAIFRELYHHPAVNTRTVSGALCVYLMVGLLFAFLYQLNGAIDHEPFFQDGQDGTASEYLYFSYVDAHDGGVRRPRRGRGHRPDDGRHGGRHRTALPRHRDRLHRRDLRQPAPPGRRKTARPSL